MEELNRFDPVITGNVHVLLGDSDAQCHKQKVAKSSSAITVTIMGTSVVSMTSYDNIGVY